MKSKLVECVSFLVVCVLFWAFLIASAIPHADTKKEESTESGENQIYSEIVFETETTKEVVSQETKPSENKKENLGEFVLTAYCSCEKWCGRWALNRPKDENGNDIVYGASGEVLKAGVSIAVDPSVIPYGTSVYIDGVEYVAHDCGGAIKGNRIDVYFDKHGDALDFGKRKANVEVVLDREGD